MPHVGHVEEGSVMGKCERKPLLQVHGKEQVGRANRLRTG